jgi:tetratricopeptide (TPR) repeat protein
MDAKYAPAHARLGATYLQKGMNEEAILELEKARALDNSPERPGRFAWPAFAYATSGQRDRALHMLSELKEHAKQRHIPPINFAIIYTGLGDKDQAFAWLEKVYEEDKCRELGEVRVNPMFDSLRSDSRFANLLRRVNRRNLKVQSSALLATAIANRKLIESGPNEQGSNNLLLAFVIAGSAHKR